MNGLYYGDNLEVLRESIKDESVDLVYLDPPFNSKRDYNLLFKSPEGAESHAQITAFEDSWHWGTQAEHEYQEVIQSSHTNVAQLLVALRGFLGANDMLAYLTMMANRLIELHRVLRPTGSLYLHCDPTASHYLKLVLDGVFGPDRFRNEIIWRRTGAHNKAQKWAPTHDVILYYTKTANFTWTNPRRPYMAGHVRDFFVPDGSGGYRTNYYGNVLTGSGTRGGESGMEWQGFDPTPKGRHWAIPGAIWEEVGVDPTGMGQHAKLDLLLKLGFIRIVPGQAWPMYERRIQPGEGPAAPDLWTFQPYTEKTVFGTEDGIDADVAWLKPQDAERLGYPTQKPLGLLARIISASSNPGDVVLDPFCGCGTAVDSAQALGRQWVGIDITHLAVTLIEKRLKDRYPGINFEVHGTPKDLEGAVDLAERDKYQFQWWACSLVNAQPFQGKKKGADGGIDGLIYFGDIQSGKEVTQKAVVSVKGGGVNAAHVRDLKGVLEREKAAIGLFVTLENPSKPMLKEAVEAGFFRAGNGKEYPKLQILTIEELFNGKRPLIPDMAMGTLTFKKAKREKTKTGDTPMLLEHDE